MRTVKIQHFLIPTHAFSLIDSLNKLMSPCVFSGRTTRQAIFHLKKEHFSRSVNRARTSAPWGNTLSMRGINRVCHLSGQGILWGARKSRLFSQGSEKATSVPYVISFRRSIFFRLGQSVTNNVVVFWFIFHEKTTFAMANFYFKRKPLKFSRGLFADVGKQFL